MAKRIAPLVTPRAGVWHRADAHAVQNDQDNSVKLHRGKPTLFREIHFQSTTKVAASRLFDSKAA
jgi:hypothetical protein